MRRVKIPKKASIQINIAFNEKTGLYDYLVAVYDGDVEFGRSEWAPIGEDELRETTLGEIFEYTGGK